MARQGAAAVLTIRPAAFGFNPETAASNRFQRPVEGELAALGRAEADGLADALARAGIEVCQVEDAPAPPKPDAVFPNNWVGFHPDGTVALYPMEAPIRRAERRELVVAEVLARTGFVERRRLDFTAHEREGRYLEGTGSLVLDHLQRVAYAARSSRTDPGLCATWGRAMGYELVLFDAIGPGDAPVYHTNVVLAIGTTWAAVAAHAIAPADRERVLERLQRDREVIPLDPAAVSGFAGNLLELAGPVIALSTTALAALGPAARTLERHGALVPVSIPTIEAAGGGSVRCMLAEVFR